MREAKMYVAATDLDGYPLGEVDLARSPDGRATEMIEWFSPCGRSAVAWRSLSPVANIVF
jgi:hypothetical protein